MPDEYPKALNCVLNGRVTSLLYPPKHVKHGQHVVAADAKEEKALKGVGVPLTGPEQVGLPDPFRIYFMPLDFGYERNKT